MREQIVGGFYPAEIEVRARRGGRARELRGRFPYNKTATVRNRGRVRKERFTGRAFSFALDDDSREINLLVGHDYGQPLASKLTGSLRLEDSAAALAFVATLPDDDEQPTWMRDAVLALDAGLMSGLSPGFLVPPKSVVPGAERLVPEEGNEGVMIREIVDAVLLELSLVTRPAYKEATVRDEIEAAARRERRRPRVWL